MKTTMMTVEAAAARIRTGAAMLVAGAESALARLPAGRWIGGTSVYFLTESGGRVEREQVMCTEIEEATDARIRILSPQELPDLAQDRFDGGLTLILIPAFSEAHTRFALDGAAYPGLFDQPLMGWITGVHLDEQATAKPRIFDGRACARHEDGAALLHVETRPGVVADLSIANPFRLGDDPGLRFVFAETGFAARTAFVGGEEVALAPLFASGRADRRLPLMANYAGALINVSVREVDEATGTVSFYAPVVAGVEYRLASPLGDYAAAFAAAGDGEGRLSCNCVLNFLYGELEGKRAGNHVGPATFGEIAYILLNQTLVRLEMKGVRASEAA
ncbi:MAG: hypothetical protein VYD87_14945 [Pseudomonadota bacterium]|nr:hypothetical protein [Pseudomonadota bacterium]